MTPPKQSKPNIGDRDLISNSEIVYREVNRYLTKTLHNTSRIIFTNDKQALQKHDLITTLLQTKFEEWMETEEDNVLVQLIFSAGMQFAAEKLEQPEQPDPKRDTTNTCPYLRECFQKTDVCEDNVFQQTCRHRYFKDKVIHNYPDLFTKTEDNPPTDYPETTP